MYYPGSGSSAIALGSVILVVAVLVIVLGLIRPTHGSMHDRFPIRISPPRA
jgi:hypothetical protein